MRLPLCWCRQPARGLDGLFLGFYGRAIEMDYLRTVLDELNLTGMKMSQRTLESLADAILDAGRVFVSGAGRSGLMVRAFANRLMHMGLSVGIVGDVSCPHSTPGDLLVIGSGSGSAESLRALAQKAKDARMKVALVTAAPRSPIAQMADIVVTIPAASKDRSEVVSAQPMASLFEQMCLITYDALVLALMDRTGETSASMFARHADLE
jgi:6-phospho-3-hexuloisomerase